MKTLQLTFKGHSGSKSSCIKFSTLYLQWKRKEYKDRSFALKFGVKKDASLTIFFQVVIQKSMNLNELEINRPGYSNFKDILK